MGGSGYDAGNAVAFDNAGAVMVTGYFGLFDGGVDFGGGVLAPQGGADAFVAKYDGSDGRYMWASKFGGDLDDYGNAVSVSPEGDVTIAGEFQGNASFAGVTASSAGHFEHSWRILVAARAWWRSYGDIVNDKASAIAVDFNHFATASIFRIDLGEGALYSAECPTPSSNSLQQSSNLTPTPTLLTFLPLTPTFTATMPGDANIHATASADACVHRPGVVHLHHDANRCGAGMHGGLQRRRRGDRRRIARRHQHRARTDGAEQMRSFRRQR
jgi:hypothetical protein